MSPSHLLYNDLYLLLKKKSSLGFYGKLAKQRWQVLLLVLIGISCLVYFVLAEILPVASVKMINEQQESALGERIYVSSVVDNKIDSASTFIAQQFANELKLSSKYNIRVTVIKQKEFNAFALPGGHIIIYAGIFDIMENSEEFVALLGHESAHINKRHSLKGLLSGMGLSLFESLLLSGWGGTGDLILKNAASLQHLNYSRSLEREADAEGIITMTDNFVNPEGMKYLMIHLKKSHKSSLPAVSFMSTHPLNDERINNAEAFIRNHQLKKIEKSQQLEYLWDELKNEHRKNNIKS